MKKKLLTILLSVFMIMTSFTTRVFAENYSTVNDILATANGGFPSTDTGVAPDNAWVYGSYKMFKNTNSNSLSISGAGSPNIGLNIEITKVDGNDKIYRCVDYTCEWLFTLDNDGKLESIKFTDIDDFGMYKNYNGTYSALKTIASILATNPDFPTSANDTPPANAWLCEAAKEAWQDADKLYVNTPFGVNDSLLKTTPLTKDGNNYKYTNVTPAFELLFVMDSNDKLSQIKVTVNLGGEMTITYEPLGDRKNLAYILENFASDFPESESNGWTNSNNSSIGLYKDGDGNLAFYGDDMFAGPFMTSEYLFSPSASNYVFDFTGINFTFVINNSKLQSIQVSHPMIPIMNGTYSAPVTVADVLAMSEEQFPTNSESGWVDSNGKRAYINNTDLKIINDSVPLDSVLTKDGNNYKYEFDTDLFYVFNIESGVLVSISETNFNSVFKPYQYTTIPTSITAGSTSDVEFATNAKFIDQASTPVTVSVDGSPLTYGTHYEVTSGSTHVKLKGSYVSTLAVGSHTIKISMTGYSDLTSPFTITGSSPSPSPNNSKKYSAPNTGIEGNVTNNYSLLKLSSLSLLAIGTYLIIKKKKDN